MGCLTPRQPSVTQTGSGVSTAAPRGWWYVLLVEVPRGRRIGWRRPLRLHLQRGVVTTAYHRPGVDTGDKMMTVAIGETDVPIAVNLEMEPVPTQLEWYPTR